MSAVRPAASPASTLAPAARGFPDDRHQLPAGAGDEAQVVTHPGGGGAGGGGAESGEKKGNESHDPRSSKRMEKTPAIIAGRAAGRSALWRLSRRWQRSQALTAFGVTLVTSPAPREAAVPIGGPFTLVDGDGRTVTRASSSARPCW